MMLPKANVFWFRRDLRLDDNAGLWHGLKSGLPVLPVFIFDSDILDELEDKQDRRLAFIYNRLHSLQKDLIEKGSTMVVRYGKPISVFNDLLKEYDIQVVFANHDYEPYAKERDEGIKSLFESRGKKFMTFKDQVIFEKYEVVKDGGSPYSVFTPYSRRWLSQLESSHYKAFETESLLANFYRQQPLALPELTTMGFEPVDVIPSIAKPVKDLICHYESTRDLPSIEGTTRQGVHLRYGTVSIRKLIGNALQLNQTFLKELIWREYFMQLLWQQPQLVNQAYKKEYDGIKWLNREEDFERWCRGETGYPIVDAGMRELSATGFMHNRVRMITASFLVKHLLIDWRWGEAWFAKKLLDFELASNNGNWQWVAGCGCDAAPYFRIFSPSAQAKKFDPHLAYIKKWVPELGTLSYPQPMVIHEVARNRCLKVYKDALIYRK